ncbi:ThrRS/AlaRS common domain-containing protein [Pleomassaria siparia CBS 279.74]|uniref:ThrRS/AlaRS common domain-containing protein n=1 Tax=Pleomassaria siparia CBS 279.74 TaxID=1314801 RepID=A0A6G1KA92_9PLEO|nr:ThrRS/AlaRS common domain-containing protein [Pleomassaria siparia CBS 279.74]
MAAAVAGPIPVIVGALSCQKDSYLQTLQTSVVSCVEYVPPEVAKSEKTKNKKTKDASQAARTNGTSTSTSTSTPEKTWLIELEDSVLFPEGGGQPTDHGTLTPLSNSRELEPESEPVPITRIERHGLRCMHFSPTPLAPGTPILQTVDYARRWDLMQQHTGQHLLSAIMDTMSLETLSWSMGGPGEMNSIEVPRKPTAEELASIQSQCNAAVRANHAITVEVPGAEGTGSDKSLPADYDRERGVVRFVRIGDLDYNACCGTHLKQTSHVSLILLHHTQTIRGTNCRLFFSAGDRAIALASASINALRAIALPLSSGSAPHEVQASVQRVSDVLSETKRREKKLLAEIVKYEGARIRADLKKSGNKVAWMHRASDGLDFVNLVVIEIKDAIKEGGVVVLASGEVKGTGSVMIVGEKNLVEGLAAKVKEVVPEIKGGGKGEKWQGKIVEWKKHDVEALREAVETYP